MLFSCFLWGSLFLSVSLFCLCMGCGRRRSSFSSLTLSTIQNLVKGLDWNYRNLLWNIVLVPSTENTPPLSSQRLSFLLDSWWLLLFPQLRSRLWSFEFSSSDQHEVLQTSSIVNNLSADYVERFFLAVRSQDGLKVTGVLQFWLVQSSEDHIWRHFAWW